MESDRSYRGSHSTHEVMESRLKLDEAKEDLWYHGKMLVRC